MLGALMHAEQNLIMVRVGKRGGKSSGAKVKWLWWLWSQGCHAEL